nr:Anti-sigma-I factor RsgI [uncultured bacterium]
MHPDFYEEFSYTTSERQGGYQCLASKNSINILKADMHNCERSDRSMKYLVMECFDSYAVLLDEEGRFVKSANLGYQVGDIVTNPVLMRDEPLETIKERSIPKRLTAGLVAIAAMLALFFGLNYYQTNFMPYSSIFMVINPEIEMVLNKKGQVLEVKGVNEDGVALIEDYVLSSKDKLVVVNELVDKAIAMGFLTEGGQVSIAIDIPDQVLFEEYGLEIRRELDGRTSITIKITDIEHKDQPSTIPPSINSPPSEPDSDDDSDYDEFEDEDFDSDDKEEDHDDDLDDDSDEDNDDEDDVDDESDYDSDDEDDDD